MSCIQLEVADIINVHVVVALHVWSLRILSDSWTQWLS